MKKCPICKSDISKYDNPYPTADCIIYDEQKGIVLIERKNEPHGFALPGGLWKPEKAWNMPLSVR